MESHKWLEVITIVCLKIHIHILFSNIYLLLCYILKILIFDIIFFCTKLFNLKMKYSIYTYAVIYELAGCRRAAVEILSVRGRDLSRRLSNAIERAEQPLERRSGETSESHTLSLVYILYATVYTYNYENYEFSHFHSYKYLFFNYLIWASKQICLWTFSSKQTFRHSTTQTFLLPKPII